MSDELHKSVRNGSSSGRNSFMTVVGSGSSVQDFAGSDVIVRLMSSMVISAVVS